MKQTSTLLLVMGMVWCGGDAPKWVLRDGLLYEGDSETPFTGVAISKYESGQKLQEATCKAGKLEGLFTTWHDNWQKGSEYTYKDGKQEGLMTMWHKNGQKSNESTWKDGKVVSETKWNKEGNEIKK